MYRIVIFSTCINIYYINKIKQGKYPEALKSFQEALLFDDGSNVNVISKYIQLCEKNINSN